LIGFPNLEIVSGESLLACWGVPVYEIFANLAPGKCEFSGGNPLSASPGQACLFGVIGARNDT
jgi:hypothetical protein